MNSDFIVLINFNLVLINAKLLGGQPKIRSQNQNPVVS